MKLSNIKQLNEETLKQETIKVLTDESLSKSAKIKKLFSFGYETREIAKILNIRYNFAYNVLANQIIIEGLAVETVKQESKKDLIISQFKAGNTPKTIAINLKTNLNYIYKVINEYKDSISESQESLTK